MGDLLVKILNMPFLGWVILLSLGIPLAISILKNQNNKK